MGSVGAHDGKAGHSYPLRKTLGESADASWKKTTGAMAWQNIRAASLASSMVIFTLVVSLGTVGPLVGPYLWKLSDEKPLIQEKLLARHGQALACTHSTPCRCV